MRLLRKRPDAGDDVEIRLDDLLEPYSSDRIPNPEHLGIAAVHCERCSHAIIYDTRFGPGACQWCDYELHIALEREENGSRTLRRTRRR